MAAGSSYSGGGPLGDVGARGHPTVPPPAIGMRMLVARRSALLFMARRMPRVISRRPGVDESRASVFATRRA
jgi:hypothetical protein